MSERTLVVLFGAPAVGKMAVGRELERITTLPLFHNHMTIELVLPFFEFGSPPFVRLVRSFRSQVFSEVAASDLDGLIFTYVWAFDCAEDLEFIQGLKDLFEREGSRVVFVELWSTLEVRLERNATALRLAEKPSKRDIEASRRRLLSLESEHRLSPQGAFPFGSFLRIDNTVKAPGEVAERIASHFALPRRPGGDQGDPTITGT